MILVKRNNQIIFFTFRDFSKFGGGQIRIDGILNSISTIENEVILISNISDQHKKSLTSNIKHLKIGFTMSSLEKRLMQFLLSVFPVFIVNIFFSNKIKQLKAVLNKYDLSESEVFFFEYLDISIGYVAKKNKYIRDYICDIHGLVPNEFKQKHNNIILNYVKYLSAVLLDKKVFSNSNGIIFASESMRRYFYKNIPKTRSKKFVIMPYYASRRSVEGHIDTFLLKEIRHKYGIKSNNKVLLFVGGFKSLGGVVDLVKAFSCVSRNDNNLRLFLIGEGEDLNDINRIIKKNKLESKVILAGLIPYNQLRTYQEIADIIICPDRSNIYSNMILHLKYIDSLASNKIVINGAFEAVKEININEILSVDFFPSDVKSLTEKILYCLDNIDMLTKKFLNNNQYVKENLVYENNPTNLLDMLEKIDK